MAKSLNLTGLSLSSLEDSIWGPGSNGIDVSGGKGGGLNYSTIPGMGWSKEIGGVFTTAFSLQSEGGWKGGEWVWVSDPETGSWKSADGSDGFNYLTQAGLGNDIVLSLPAGARAVVLTLEDGSEAAQTPELTQARTK